MGTHDHGGVVYMVRLVVFRLDRNGWSFVGASDKVPSIRRWFVDELRAGNGVAVQLGEGTKWRFP